MPTTFQLRCHFCVSYVCFNTKNDYFTQLRSMITMQNFLLQFAMNTLHYLTRIRFALVLRKIHFTLDDKVHFCGKCIVTSRNAVLKKMSENVFVIDISSDEEDFTRNAPIKLMPFNMMEALNSSGKTMRAIQDSFLRYSSDNTASTLNTNYLLTKLE